MNLRQGSILVDTGLDPPWNLLIVKTVTSDQVAIKRPFTHPGKTFVLFDDQILPNPLPEHITITQE